MPKPTSQHEVDKQEAYSLMNFTVDRYKVLEFILFGQTAEYFSKNFKYGDLVAFCAPKVMDQKYNSGVCLSVKNVDQLILLGRSSDYTICRGDQCAEFLNSQKQTKCMLHIEEDNDMAIKRIKANRANLRSDFVDSEKISSMRAHQKKLERQRIGYGFRKTQIEDNEYLVTPEVKRKLKQKQKKAENMYSDYMEKRNKKDTDIMPLSSIKCKERDIIDRNYKEERVIGQFEKKTTFMEIDSDGELCIPGKKDK